MQKLVLSIDGGGIRGLIPALILAELEKRTGKATAKMFDMIAGTSTGGILALGLTQHGNGDCPLYSAEEMADIYRKHGTRVFPKSGWRRFTSMGGLRNCTYKHKGFEGVLLDYLGQSKLSDSLCDVVVTAYDIERRRPHFFKSHRARGEANRDYFIKDVARATSAAPTFFEPAQIDNIEQSYKSSLIDGGVYANNPASCALAEARVLYGEDTDITVISIGTGELIKPIMHSRARKWGKMGWVRPILDVMFDGVADTVDYQLKQGLPEGNYLRLQTILDEGSDAMDDTRPENIRALEYKAEQILEQQAEKIDLLVEVLK